MSEYIATHTFQYTVKPSNGKCFLMKNLYSPAQ